MKNTLKTLVKIQKFKIDEQRKILLPLLEEEQQIIEKQNALEKECAKEKSFAKNPAYTADFGVYLKRYKQTKKQLQEDLELVRLKIDTIKNLITEEFKTQKTYEIIHENRQQEEIDEINSKEAKTLDELQNNAYIQKRKNNN